MNNAKFQSRPICPILFRLAASSPVLFRITKSRRIWFHPSCSISFRPDPSSPLCHPIPNSTVSPPTVPSSFIHSCHIPALPVLSRTTNSRPRTVYLSNSNESHAIPSRIGLNGIEEEDRMEFISTERDRTGLAATNRRLNEK